MGWEAASAWFVHVGKFFLSSLLILSQACRQDYHWGGGATLGLNTHRQRRGWPKPFLRLLHSALWDAKASAWQSPCRHFTGVASTWRC